MERLPKGSLSLLSKQSKIPAKYLSELVSTNKRPSRKRAQILEQASSEIGKQIPAAIWLLGTQNELREALLSVRV